MERLTQASLGREIFTKLKPKKIKSSQLCMRLDEDMLKRLKIIADKNKLNVTEAVRQILQNAIND